MLDTITVDACNIFLILGLPYPIYKIITKKKWQDASKPSPSITKRVLYQSHIIGPIVSVMAGFIHGLIITPWSQAYVTTGWLLGIVMVALGVTGAFLGIQTKFKPMTGDDDARWKKMRIAKWILTVLVFLTLALHYLIY